MYDSDREYVYRCLVIKGNGHGRRAGCQFPIPFDIGIPPKYSSAPSGPPPSSAGPSFLEYSYCDNHSSLVGYSCQNTDGGMGPRVESPSPSLCTVSVIHRSPDPPKSRSPKFLTPLPLEPFRLFGVALAMCSASSYVNKSLYNKPSRSIRPGDTEKSILDICRPFSQRAAMTRELVSLQVT